MKVEEQQRTNRNISRINWRHLSNAGGDGKKLYEEGVPSPCASCHGPEAKGADAFPRLAGQLHDYVYGKLTNWEKERGQDKANPDTSAIMQPIAHDLTAAQIKAVAAYVSQLQ